MENDTGFSRLIIPSKLKAGFQKRTETYSGKLAYVVYIDEKGVLRKEASWKSWIDKKIPVLDLENVPTEGFVLNRNVGGARNSYSSWDVRIEKVRVYDPRGFEFEISIPNLLFILQECSSIKGKGLEGEFVYSWNKSELILLPTSSQEYKESTEHTELISKKVTKDDRKLGYLYKNNKHQLLMYMGQHQWWPQIYPNYLNMGKTRHVFLICDPQNKGWKDIPKSGQARYGKNFAEERYLALSGFDSIKERVSDKEGEDYAEEYERLAKTHLIDNAESIVTKKFNWTSVNQSKYFTLFSPIYDDNRNVSGYRSVPIRSSGNYYNNYCSRPNNPDTNRKNSNVSFQYYEYGDRFEMSLVKGKLVTKKLEIDFETRNSFLGKEQLDSLVYLGVKMENGHVYWVSEDDE